MFYYAHKEVSMKIKFHNFILPTFCILIFFVSSCIGQTKPVPISSLKVTQTSTILITNTPSIAVSPTYTPPPSPTLTSTILPTPDICNPAQWQDDGIYILSTKQFGALEPGGPNTFNRILIAQNPVWEDFRQKDHGEMRIAGVIFHETAWGHTLGTGVNPAVLLITYGIERNWDLPAYGALVAKVDQIRGSLYQHELEWILGEVDQSQYPAIKNGATYALFRYFNGSQEHLEIWCRTYVDVFGESPLEEFDH